MLKKRKNLLMLFFGCFVSGIVAIQIYFFCSIALLKWFDPNPTAFMRNERWRLCGVHFLDCQLSHEWVPYKRISSYLKHAVIAGEDSGFVNHDGFEFDAIKQAWQKNTRRGKMVRGGSTITQQLAKNLFLTGEKSYLRKGQELIIAMMLEMLLSKERIFEIYLNSVEWGEGVFGVQAAAQHYFRVSAQSLNSWQAARLAAALPAPKCFDKQRYCKKNSVNFDAVTWVIIARMNAVALP